MAKHELTTKEVRLIEKEALLSDPRILMVSRSKIIGGTTVDYLLEAHDDIGRPSPSFVVKSRMILNGTQQPDVIEGTFDRRGDAEQFADELVVDIRDEWPAVLRRVGEAYKLVRGNDVQYVWVDEG